MEQTQKEIPRTDGVLQLGLASLGTFRWAAADITAPLEEARRRLDLSPIAAVALGRALTAAALLIRFSTKVPGRLLFEIRGDGPLEKISVEVSRDGHMRGLVGAPQIETPESGELDIAWAIGKGTLSVTRISEKRGRYSSQVELVSGEISKDLAHFLEQSEQIHSAVLLGVLPRPDGIAAAGGFIIEALPGTEDQELVALENNIARLDGVSVYLERGGIAALRDAVVNGLGPEEIERYPLIYNCRCSRESLLDSLRTVAAADLESVVDPQGQCAVECAFCGKRYLFPVEELQTADEPRTDGEPQNGQPASANGNGTGGGSAS